MEFTKREYQQFYHGISMSLLSKKSAQKWRYDDETAEEIRFLEGLESKVLDKIRQADTPQTDYPCNTCANKGDHDGKCKNCVADSEPIRLKTPSNYEPKQTDCPWK